MADLVDEVFGSTPAEPEVVAESPDPQPEPQPQIEVKEPEPEPEPKEDDRRVPLTALLDTRDRAKEAERRAEIAEQRIREYEAAKSPAKAPDPYDDPDAYNAYVEAKVEERLVGERFQISDLMARDKHGDEAVEAAVEWAKGRAQADPTFAAGYMKERNPIDWIVKQHKRDAILSDLGDDPVAYARKIAEREGWLTAPTIAAPAVVAPASRPAAPPRSIASDVSASVSAPDNSDPLADLNAIFNKR